jgi:hypothetical protein
MPNVPFTNEELRSTIAYIMPLRNTGLTSTQHQYLAASSAWENGRDEKMEETVGHGIDGNSGNNSRTGSDGCH